VAFGADYDDHIRISLASAPDDLATGLDAIVTLVGEG
jgi:hypothetical protein